MDNIIVQICLKHPNIIQKLIKDKCNIDLSYEDTRDIIQIIRKCEKKV